MKKLIFALLIFALFSCSDARQQPDISGAWNSLTYPANYYLFHSDGILEIHTTFGGTIIQEKWYGYTQNRETGALEVRDRNGLYFQGSVTFSDNGNRATMEQPDGLQIQIERW